jgi:hypothetical protein
VEWIDEVKLNLTPSLELDEEYETRHDDEDMYEALGRRFDLA